MLKSIQAYWHAFYASFVYSLRTAEFLPGLMIFYWLILQSGRLQVGRVYVLQNNQRCQLERDQSALSNGCTAV